MVSKRVSHVISIKSLLFSITSLHWPWHQFMDSCHHRPSVRGTRRSPDDAPHKRPVLICRIKTGHSNLVSCFGPRMRALSKVFYRGESRGKISCQRPNPRAKTWHKIWMTGLNPNYDTIPIPSLQNSQNKCKKSSFTYDRRRHLILPLPPVHTLPALNARTCCSGAPIDDVTISYFRSHRQFESSVNASCQRIIMWIIRTSIMHIY